MPTAELRLVNLEVPRHKSFSVAYHQPQGNLLVPEFRSSVSAFLSECHLIERPKRSWIHHSR
jgi:hypothetical protein